MGFLDDLQVAVCIVVVMIVHDVAQCEPCVYLGFTMHSIFWERMLMTIVLVVISE